MEADRVLVATSIPISDGSTANDTRHTMVFRPRQDWRLAARARTGVELEAVGFGDALEVPHEELLAAALALARELGAPLGQVVLRHAQRMSERLFELVHLRAQLCSILVPAHRADASHKDTTRDY